MPSEPKISSKNAAQANYSIPMLKAFPINRKRTKDESEDSKDAEEPQPKEKSTYSGYSSGYAELIANAYGASGRTLGLRKTPYTNSKFKPPISSGENR